MSSRLVGPARAAGRWPTGYRFTLLRVDDVVFGGFLHAREVYRWLNSKKPKCASSLSSPRST